MTTDSTKRPNPAPPVEQLYPLVSEAIQRAETLADLGSPTAPAASIEVSQLEERIAEHLPASDPEGAVARRGAVRAAIIGRQISRARALVERFVEDPEADEELRHDLRKLLEEAEQAQAERFPHAAARYGMREIHRLAHALERQAAPFPIG